MSGQISNFPYIGGNSLFFLDALLLFLYIEIFQFCKCLCCCDFVLNLCRHWKRTLCQSMFNIRNINYFEAFIFQLFVYILNGHIIVQLFHNYFKRSFPFEFISMKGWCVLGYSSTRVNRWLYGLSYYWYCQMRSDFSSGKFVNFYNNSTQNVLTYDE